MKLINDKPKVRSFYLTKIEKIVLYKKYVGQGLSYYEASKRVSGCVKHLSSLVDKLRKQNINEEYINLRFKEEFAKIIERF